MNSKPIIMIAIAILFGAVSIFVADVWMDSAVNAKVNSTNVRSEKKPETVFETIVVATKSLRYGDVLSSDSFKEIPWAQNQLPDGAFKNIQEILSEEGRVVLSPMEINEPILLTKISGKNGRAALSNMLGRGMRAVTIRVDDVAGVAGFITPGDRVDIALTRSGEEASTQIILQNIKVLTVDQKADERSTGPELVRAVTVEVGAASAQKITLARAVGTLSLSLRAAGDQDVSFSGETTLADFSNKTKPMVAETTSGLKALFDGNKVPRQRTVVVTRGMTPTPYEVVSEEYLQTHQNLKPGPNKPVQ